MRVTHKSIYDASQTRLGNLVEDFTEANRVVVTGKRISRFSDDPVGISRVVDLRSSLANLEQMTDNISTARTWLDASESSVGAIRDLMSDTKVLAISIRSDTITADQRANAAVMVEQTLGQVLDLANTSVNGQYLFSGTKTDTRAYAFDDPANPTAVTYAGNDGAFALKTGKNTSMTVGYSGNEFFDSKTLTVDGTNNRIDFMEDTGSGFGAELSAVIPPGEYTRNELAAAIGNAMDDASVGGVDFTVSYDPDLEEYTIQHTGARVNLLWASGTNAQQSIAPDIGFDNSTDDLNVVAPIMGDQPADWGIFKTLFDMKQALEINDTSGINRSMSRLDTQFNNMVNAVSKIGYKWESLDVRTNMIEDLDVSYSTQKSDIEDADIVEAITTLQAKENAYQAALSSTSRIMQLSLVDYL